MAQKERMWLPRPEDIRACLQFYTRLPIASTGDAGPPDFSRLAIATPVAGAIVGSIGAGGLICAAVMHLPPLVCAICGVASLVMATGALHEDGLADVADGFGGGATREAKLAIMRDSRVGAYGVVALNLSLMFRVAALAALVGKGVVLAALALIWASALSRVAGLAPMLIGAPARADGAGVAAVPITRADMRRAATIAAAMALLPFAAGASIFLLCIAMIGAALAAIGVSLLAQRQIGGYTGDVMGAAQQAAEIVVLAALSAGG